METADQQRPGPEREGEAFFWGDGDVLELEEEATQHHARAIRHRTVRFKMLILCYVNFTSINK